MGSSMSRASTTRQEEAMPTYERTRYFRDLRIRAASIGVAGLAVFGCVGRDEPQQVSAASAPSTVTPQTPLDGATVPKYVEALATLSGARADGTRGVSVD